MDGDRPIETVGASSSGETPLIRAASRLFHTTEQVIYVILGLVLSVTALVALAGAARLLWIEFSDWTEIDAISEIIDRLLFVLMLIEILYTVRASMQSGALSSEPFLVVGLIACIRRILVISLEISKITQPDKWGPHSPELFQAAMVELGVLGGLVVILVGAIFFVRKFRLR